MVEDGAFSHKIDHVTILKEILNLVAFPNCITGSRDTAILLHGWILPFGGTSVAINGTTPFSFIYKPPNRGQLPKIRGKVDSMGRGLKGVSLNLNFVDGTT